MGGDEGENVQNTMYEILENIIKIGIDEETFRTTFLNLWVKTPLEIQTTFTPESPKTMGKHRYLHLIHNSSKGTVMK